MDWRMKNGMGGGVGRSWTGTGSEIVRASRDYKLPHTDSGQNSLEYWDYSVELELLKGPEDLQLAAELGKTLLERNRELESNIKHQQNVIEDQLQEIEYLSKQTAALREVNDSRLRIYEQLEISIQELEKNNQRLSAEGSSDKKKIKGLCANIESLEARCDELQRNLEEARAGAQQGRGRNTKRRNLILEDQSYRRSHSCENTTQDEEEDEEEGDSDGKEKLQANEDQTSDDKAAEELERRTKLVTELQERLKDSQSARVSEVRQREELEIQLACIAQENAVLQDQLLVLREKEVTLRSFDEELASLDDASSGRLCRKCLGHVDDTASNPGLSDLHDSIEDTDASIESIHGECALVKLKNGGYAWGSQYSQESPASPRRRSLPVKAIPPVLVPGAPRTPCREKPRNHLSTQSSSDDVDEEDQRGESLASIGQVVSQVGSGGTSPGTEASDAPHNSLLSELDTSYRILIEKYEALLEAREQQQQSIQHGELNNSDVVHPGVDDLSGPMSLLMTDGMHDPSAVTIKCQRCHTCTCDIKSSVIRPKSNIEEYSEVETSSSGFSDGETRLSNKGTQTYDELVPREIFEDTTPTPTLANRCLDLSSPINPCDKRFQAAPEYKKLFQEIFTVLKKTVDEQDTQTTTVGGKTPHSEAPTSNIIAIEVDSEITNNKSELPKTESEVSSGTEETLMNRTSGSSVVEPESANTAEESVPVANDIEVTKQPEVAKEALTRSKDEERSPRNPDNQLKRSEILDETRVTQKPPRPDSLDLGGNSSRSSSRQRRRKRHHRVVRLDSLTQQQQQQQQYHQAHYQYSQSSYHHNHVQNSSVHRHHRRDRETQHIHHQHQRQHSEEFPNLQGNTEGEQNKTTRIVYNSNRGRCEHHRSRKHRDRMNNSHNQRYHQYNSQEATEEQYRSQGDHSRTHTNEADSKERTTHKINYPSVEVAKLRKLEMTYAEALKRSYYTRKY